MRFPDFLRTTVLLCAAAATVLAVLTLIGAKDKNQATLVPIAAIWWVLAAAAGVAIGRRQQHIAADRRAACQRPHPTDAA